MKAGDDDEDNDDDYDDEEEEEGRTMIRWRRKRWRRRSKGWLSPLDRLLIRNSFPWRSDKLD